MTELSTEEFSRLRQTIALRGSLRPAVFLAGLAAWAALLLWVLMSLPNPVMSVVPLLVLAATFEAVRTLHAGVERIGRYLHVYYEEAAGGVTPAWERTATRFGPGLPGAGGHPLFVPLFLLATVANLLAVLLPGPLPVELGTLAVPHAAFVVWMLYADRGARRQRAHDEARYQALKRESVGLS